MRRRTVLSAASIALPTALAGCSLLDGGTEVTETVDSQVDVADGTPVSVVGQNGSIHVTTTDAEAVEVEAVKRTRGGRDALDEVEVQLDESGGRLRIQAVYPENRDLLSRPVVVDFEVAVPAGVPVDRLATGNGAVTANGVAGDATLASSNGSVTAEDVDGYVSLRTTNGSIDATGVSGPDRAVTTNGAVDVELRALRGDVPVETTNGDVTVRTATDLAATFELETSVGDVSVDGLSLDRSTDGSDRVVGDLNGGGDRVTAETTNGDVTLRTL
ncbi:DUF4097 family beta strand repeat-containing protein [Haloarchaeobius salinus]|uniref:DUF4097 family beta strand repeat-containing protein n=1 Tax=Haloarchaeobius salinus TaxID=1198298 RepID=UPI002108BB62|nr:DUF4097 family beta strand repeat-containing protein [Haloarchaeobius salinus]